MTIIATDGQVMVADGLVTRDTTILTASEKKLIRRGERVYGMAGMTSMTDVLIDWIENGADPDKQPKTNRDDDNHWSVLVAGKDGVWLYTSLTPYRASVSLPYAIGYGAEQAMLAMRMGKGARESVELACTCDVWIGGEIQEEQLEARILQTVPLSVQAGSVSAGDRDRNPSSKALRSSLLLKIIKGETLTSEQRFALKRWQWDMRDELMAEHSDREKQRGGDGVEDKISEFLMPIWRG